MTFPAVDLFLGADTFPDLVLVDMGGYKQPIAVVLNGLCLTSTDQCGVEWMADTLSGWYGSPASSMQPQQKLNAPGSWAGPRQFGPRNLTLSGFVLAPSAAALRDALKRLKVAASLDAAPFTVIEEYDLGSAIVYRQGEVTVTRASDVGAVWTVQLQALEPRTFGPAITASTALPSSTGGLTWPLTWPVVWSGVTETGVLQLDNPGNYTSPLFIRITGPVVGPRIRHVTSGREMTLATDYTLAAGAFLDIDMENRTVLEAGVVPRNEFVTSRDWFDADPGINEFIFDADVSNTTARMDLTVLPAYQ